MKYEDVLRYTDITAACKNDNSFERACKGVEEMLDVIQRKSTTISSIAHGYAGLENANYALTPTMQIAIRDLQNSVRCLENEMKIAAAYGPGAQHFTDEQRKRCEGIC